MNGIDTKTLEEQVRSLPDKMPRHIAFIMDGNGRWAKKRALPRLFGHREGVKSVREMVEIGVDLGIEVMTFYAFSKENWKRPAQEVTGLMQLLLSTIRKEVDDLDQNNVRLKTIGALDDLPELQRREFELAMERLSKNTGLTLTLALSYSGRQEIVRAMQRLMAQGVTEITEEAIGGAMDTANLPDPDLLIRTSGELRISNFLLWQCAYTEIYVTDTYWPDFRKRQLLEAVWDYQNRERRFGCISEQLVQS